MSYYYYQGLSPSSDLFQLKSKDLSLPPRVPTPDLQVGMHKYNESSQTHLHKFNAKTLWAFQTFHMTGWPGVDGVRIMQKKWAWEAVQGPHF